MSSGQVHAAASIALAPVCAGFSYALANDLSLALACGAGCTLGILLSPDLDQPTLSSSESTLVRYTFGLGFLWVMLWHPYARAIPHRSPLSHLPLVGTAGRLLYLGVLAAIPAYFWGWNFQISPENWRLLGYGVAGLAVSDTAHFIFDVVSSRVNRTRRRISQKISKMTGGIL